jgi:hypothetical protein
MGPIEKTDTAVETGRKRAIGVSDRAYRLTFMDKSGASFLDWHQLKRSHQETR